MRRSCKLLRDAQKSMAQRGDLLLIDYVFRTAHLKISKLQQKGQGLSKMSVPMPDPPYTHTAFHIRNLCKDPAAKHRLKHNPHPRHIDHII